MKLGICLSVATGLLTAGCAALSSGAAPASLAGTSWRLVAIQSMDDAQGTQVIPATQAFTVYLGQDGQASFKLDCNRGSGRWTAQAASADSGSFGFGPLASTRAMCPPPSLDARVARDLSAVRSYRLKDGRLYMSLMADGGIYEWVPLRE